MVYFEFPRRRGQEAFPWEPGAWRPPLRSVPEALPPAAPSCNLLSIVQKKGRGIKGVGEGGGKETSVH